MKQDRLLLESQVVAAVDKHTNNYNRLDNDITCILEEVPEVVIANSHKEMTEFIENVKGKKRFKHVRDVLDKCDVDDYSDVQLTEELALALYLDNNLDLGYLNKWITSITSLKIPSNAQYAIIKHLKQKYGYEE